MGKRVLQSSFFKTNAKAFGGTLLKNKKNRVQRPIVTKKPMHLVLRSTQAVGRQSFLSPRNAKRVQETIRKFAQKNGVRIYQIGNSGNHIHLLIQLGNRHAWRPFIRGVTSALAFAVGAYEKGRALKSKFWDFRPFTRVVEWSRDYLLQRDYVFLNTLEGIGVIPHSRKWRDSSVWRRWVEDERLKMTNYGSRTLCD